LLNLAILKPDVQQFITDNLKSNITKLILKGSPFKDISVQELANQIIAKHKSEQKLSTWFNATNIYYPAKISIEQTSSEITAEYKANLVFGHRIIDITGGFGVDCFYFSKIFKEVIHCEINPELSAIVKYNCQKLKLKNISTISGDGIAYLKNTALIYDCIYIDPSRRNETKGKVFLLAECLPNVPDNIDYLFTKTNQILIKVSPILDITSAINELKHVKEVHIIAVNNEVKEVLFLLEKEYLKDIFIKTINIQKKDIQLFNFKYQERATSIYSKPLAYLYEPNAAILKSGGFHHVGKKLNIFKLQENSHLYTSNKQVDFPGRIFKIIKVMPYDKKKLQKLLPEKKANITIRNFPKPVSEIRKELKLKDGGNNYLFCTKDQKNSLIVLHCFKC
jgi:hypothetical protein